MQRKTINKVISKKVDEWLETITDAPLKKDVRKSLLVSGGCITSLFLNQPVNDFDVYIQDINVLYRLANYYFPNKVIDGRKREQYLEDLKRSNGYSVTEDMGAEFVRYKNLKADQIKMDVPKYGEKFTLEKGNDAPKYQVAFISENAISLTDQIQIVTRFSGTPEQIHVNFDFMHATNYFTFENGLVTNIVALESTLTKELKYQGSLYPLTSIIRMKKFIMRGWKISAGEMLKMMFQVSELNLKNPQILEEQLIGVDIAYFGVLIEILKDVPEEKITAPYLNALIDKVFNSFEDHDDDAPIDYQPED